MISVIVPVYKVEAYLDRCVQSILDQSYADFELVLVDDGSPDRSGAMCDEWAKKDSRIKVVHKENGGLSDARNAGFTASQGEWVTFVDSDDYIHRETLRVLYEAVIHHGTAVSCGGLMGTTGEPLPDEKMEMSSWTPGDFYIRHADYAIPAYGKLYRRDLVLPYPVGKLHEDRFVTHKILFACDRIAVVDARLYACYRNPESITRAVWSPRRMDDFEACEEQTLFFSRMGNRELLNCHIQGYVQCLIQQMKLIDALPQPEKYGTEKAWMKKKAKKLLRKYLFSRGFVKDENMWLYATFYPNTIRAMGTAKAVWCKLVGRK